MPIVGRGEIETYYEQTGAGPDIVWICGGGGAPERTWNVYQVPEFSDFRNTVFHNRGIGQTSCDQELPWTMADFARDDEDDKAVPGYRNYLVYSDESGIHGANYYGFGTLWMPHLLCLWRHCCRCHRYQARVRLLRLQGHSAMLCCGP